MSDTKRECDNLDSEAKPINALEGPTTATTTTATATTSATIFYSLSNDFEVESNYN